MPNAFHSPSSVSYHPRGGKEFIKTAKCTTAVSLKSCTSCTDLDFTRLATTISRKINYDVTQSRPEGAARLHTPQDKKKRKKKCSTLSSSTTQNKKKKQKKRRNSEEGTGKGGEKREGRRRMGVIFSFSYIDDSNIPPPFKISSLQQKFHRKLCLFEIQRRARRHAHAHPHTRAHEGMHTCKDEADTQATTA